MYGTGKITVMGPTANPPTPPEERIPEPEGLRGQRYDNRPEPGDERIYVKGCPMPAATPRFTDTAQVDYAGNLYPPEALHELSHEADGISTKTRVDGILRNWLNVHVKDPQVYLEDLFLALKDRKCIPGLCSRLNMACLSDPTTDTVTVTRHSGGTTRFYRTRPSLDWLPTHTHTLVCNLCRGVNQPYLTDVAMAAHRMETINNSFDLEQVLLTRIAYIACHTQLSLRRAVPTLPMIGRQ